MSFTLIFTGDRIPYWQVYLISPNVFYLESTINPLFITPESVSFHVAVSNLIILIYFYFLSCLILGVRSALKNLLLKILVKKDKE
ncbi:MAG: hypothetical protein GTN36_03900 [Candidatus Aenigmarchaeota archaeon]|nr:hypothetical protein [Candidatus Aenigmarchaeota archaeon]